MLADLKGAGATLGPGTSFGQVFDGKSGHWVAMQGKTFINTARGGEAGEVKPDNVQIGAERFSARLRFTSNGDLQVQTRYRKDAKAGKGDGWEATMSPSDSRNDVQRAIHGNFKQIVNGLLKATEGKLSN